MRVERAGRAVADQTNGTLSNRMIAGSFVWTLFDYMVRYEIFVALFDCIEIIILSEAWHAVVNSALLCCNSSSANM